MTALSTALTRRGHDIHVAFVYPGVHSEALASAGCQLHRLPATAWWHPSLLPTFIGMVRRVKPDVLHTWLPYMDVVGGASARLLRVPWVMSERSAAPCYPSSLR